MGSLVAAALLSGCGEAERRLGEEPDAGVVAAPDAPACQAGPPQVDLEAFGRDFYQALCAATVRCDLFTTFRDQAECVAHYDSYYEGLQTKFLRGVGDAVAHRALSIDAAAATRCFASLQSGACPVVVASADCRGLFVGSRAAGAVCYSDQECAAPGSYCAGLDSERSCGIGRCTAAAALGQSCGDDVPCAPGDHCVARAGGSVCETGDPGARCGDGGDCDRELWCQRGSCVADLPDGQPCQLDYECGGGSLCVGELSSSSGLGVCSKVSAPGDVCDDYCFGSLFCEVAQFGENGRCAALPQLGEPCFAALGRCGGIDLICSAQDACVPLPVEGQACTAGSLCAAGTFCSTDLTEDPSGSCVARAPAGAACERDGHCQSFDCGDDGKCRAWTSCYGALPGEPCLATD